MTLDPVLEQRGRFVRYLRKFVESDEAAEDLFQQALLKAVEAAPEAEGENIVFWFQRVLKNAVIDHYRSRGANSRKLEGLIEELRTTGRDHEAAREHAPAEACACFEGVLPELKAEYAEIVRRVDLESGAPEAVARDLGISLENLRVRLHRGRKALRDRLQKLCGSCSTHGCLECSCNS